MNKPTPDTQWFDGRRFVIAPPEFNENGWGVLDLKTSALLITGVSVEESGLYADTCEERYNSAHDEQIHGT